MLCGFGACNSVRASSHASHRPKRLPFCLTLAVPLWVKQEIDGWPLGSFSPPIGQQRGVQTFAAEKGADGAGG
jgi:hypothetical protein